MGGKASGPLKRLLSVVWLCILGGSTDVPGGVDDFLRLARTLIGRWITAEARRERADKRNRTPNEEAPGSTGSLDQYVPDGVSVLQSSLPRPEAETIARDETQWLLRLLDPNLRRFAESRFLDGLTVEQIGLRTGPSVAAPGRGSQFAGTSLCSVPSKV
jgi:hypothetical protein